MHIGAHEDALANIATAVAAADDRIGARPQNELLLVKRAEHADGGKGDLGGVVRAERDLYWRAVSSDQLADLVDLRGEGFAARLEALGASQNLFCLIEQLR